MPETKPENLFVRLLAVPFLLILGCVFAAAAFFPGCRDFIKQWLGEVNFIYMGMGFLFFYTAVLVAEKNQMRKKFIGLLEEIQTFFFGAAHKKVSGAVEILINSLKGGGGKAAETAASELCRLTGRDFGTDHDKWKSWWADNRVSFLKTRKDSNLSERRGSDDSSN